MTGLRLSILFTGQSVIPWRKDSSLQSSPDDAAPSRHHPLRPPSRIACGITATCANAFFHEAQSEDDQKNTL